MNPQVDDAVEEIRRGRMALSEECGHDLDRFMVMMKSLDREIRLRRARNERSAQERSRQDGEDLKQKLHEAMLEIYRKAKTEAGYNATRFLKMVNERGGLETAQMLLRSETLSEDYVALWERKRLDLSVEALVLTAPWKALFSDEEREIARKRLREFNFRVA